MESGRFSHAINSRVYESNFPENCCMWDTIIAPRSDQRWAWMKIGIIHPLSFTLLSSQKARVLCLKSNCTTTTSRRLTTHWLSNRWLLRRPDSSRRSAAGWLRHDNMVWSYEVKVHLPCHNSHLTSFPTVKVKGMKVVVVWWWCWCHRKWWKYFFLCKTPSFESSM